MVNPGLEGPHFSFEEDIMSTYCGHKTLARFLQLGCRIATQKPALALALLSTTLFISSCSSVSGANNPQAGSASNVRVQISPASAQISPGGTVQFTAMVSGTSSVGVIWSATGGTISSTGLFRGSTSAPVTVTATSIANSAASASANVNFLNSGNLTILSTSLPAGTAGSPYSAGLMASGGMPPYVWSIISGGLPQGLSLASDAITGTAMQAGNSSLTLKVKDSAAHSATASMSLQVTSNSLNYTGYDGPAQLPLVYLQTSLADTPAPGSTISVNAGGDLQSALNDADCGDTIQLQSGAVFSGNFKFPAKSCDDQHWIVIRTSAPDSALPSEGTRVNPCYAGVASLPGRPSFTCPAVKNVMVQIVYTGSGISGPIELLAGANHYRFIGLEITRALPTVHIWDLVTPDTAADKIIFDRDWIHGTATDETKGGVHLSGVTNAAIVDSYFSDFHCISLHGSCIDSQAINGGDGTLPAGPYKIDDNFLEASGESIMFGGGPGTSVPADIEIRYNDLFKPLLWQPGAPGYVGGYTGDPFIVKNNLELKNGQRVLLEGNVLQNVWGGFTQHGFSVLLNPATQNGGCPTCRVTDITIRYNTISNVGGGFSIGNGEGKTGGYAAGGERYSIHDVLVDNVDKTKYDGYGLFVLMTSTSTTEILNNLWIQHNTAFPDPDTHILSILDPVSQMPGFLFANNLIASPTFPIVSAGGGPANCAASENPLTSVQKCFQGYVFAGNLFIGGLTKFPSNQWPAGQMFVTSADGVDFVDYADGNYALSPSSPYVNRGTDGLNPGADIVGLNRMIAGVE
jgi:hypothetical protein